MSLAAVVGASALLAGCTADAGAQGDSAAFADQVAAIIEQAEAGGAGDAQMAILRHAQAEGELSLEDARTAARAAVQCMTEAGVLAGYGESASRSGLVVPEWSAEAAMGDEELDLAIRVCDEQEASWVNQLYQTQPSSLAFTEESIEQTAPLVRSCLESNGYPTDPSASPADVIAQALEVDSDTGSAVDCITEAGIW
ncbi:hypothetical protein LGT39_01190 [Demequina sp. TTPB684]|uniref:hypothetical protein n=1 Tax=unclassified Demequina TaxID=2620311 RepID=UPI001CF5633B|nr:MULTISPECIES: hypothetical protein [unclassified Demequina]MCB2411461.1 hypothetical protein [Demequina sp. TTPB684]UPU88323.1 hypothetical protein LGT36_013970 [Demequina sp. TMPB413]